MGLWEQRYQPEERPKMSIGLYLSKGTIKESAKTIKRVNDYGYPFGN